MNMGPGGPGPRLIITDTGLPLNHMGQPLSRREFEEWQVRMEIGAGLRVKGSGHRSDSFNEFVILVGVTFTNNSPTCGSEGLGLRLFSRRPDCP